MPSQPLSDSQSLVPKRKNKREEAEMDITPMIDVTFLLMIFFMVAARIDPQAPVALPTAKHGDAIPEKNCVVIVVAEGAANTADIYFGTSKDEDSLLASSLSPEEQENLIGEYVKKEMNDGEKEAVLIKAESSVKAKDMDRVYKAVGLVLDEGLSIHTAVHEER